MNNIDHDSKSNNTTFCCDRAVNATTLRAHQIHLEYRYYVDSRFLSSIGALASDAGGDAPLTAGEKANAEAHAQK
jgi:hypothetical protein